VLLIVSLLLNVITLMLMLQLYSNYNNLRYQLDVFTTNNKLLQDKITDLSKKLEVYEQINVLIQTMIKNIMAKVLNQTLSNP
jgi:N-acetylmuramic acid 6-phosphate (MurNAc-6-P) etherase